MPFIRFKSYRLSNQPDKPEEDISKTYVRSLDDPSRCYEFDHSKFYIPYTYFLMQKYKVNGCPLVRIVAPKIIHHVDV